MTTNAIVIKGLAKRFGTVKALDGIDLTVAPETAVCSASTAPARRRLSAS